MKKRMIGLACLLCMVLMVGCAALDDAAQLQEYDLDGDTVVTVNALVGERTVTGVSTSKSGGTTTKEYTYESSSVQDDLTDYLTELVYEQGYIIVDEDIDLENTPGTAKVGIESPSDSDKVITVQMDYTRTGYTITLTRMTGTLNEY